MKRFKITIDRNACIGCGGCAEIDPAVFAIDEEGKAKVISTSGNRVEDAAVSCPVNAITISKRND